MGQTQAPDKGARRNLSETIGDTGMTNNQETDAGLLSKAPTLDPHGGAPLDPSPKALRQSRARRRWAGVSVVALALLSALLLDGVSGRTALMLGGMLLAFSLSADRLDQFED
jgi:hypothetical protein